MNNDIVQYYKNNLDYKYLTKIKTAYKLLRSVLDYFVPTCICGMFSLYLKHI